MKREFVNLRAENPEVFWKLQPYQALPNVTADKSGQHYRRVALCELLSLAKHLYNLPHNITRSLDSDNRASPHMLRAVLTVLYSDTCRVAII